MSARPPASAEVPRFAKDGGKNAKTKDGKEKQVVPVSTAEYGCINWRWWLNNVTISAGLQNVTDEDPPFVAGSFENGYDESLATIKGRFWYVGQEEILRKCITPTRTRARCSRRPNEQPSTSRIESIPL
jgi:hypothetical protein